MKIYLALFLLGLSFFSLAEVAVIDLSIPLEKSVTPDLAYLNVELWSKEKTAKDAQEKLKDQLNKLQEIADAQGFKKEDLVTERNSFGPDYEWDSKANKNKLVGYTGSHQLKLFVKKIDSLGKLLDQMTSAEISIIGIDWDYKNKTVIEDELIEQAIEQLKTRAEKMAKAAGVKIKGIHRLSYNSMSVAPMRERGMMKAMALDAARPAPQINPGEVKVRVQVEATFEIAP